MYGTTTGNFIPGDYGAVFELPNGSSTITTLASFDGTNGAYPASPLIMDGSGNLYGTARYGGDSNYGTIFELAAGSGTITPLASFDGTNGAYPFTDLVVDSSGNMYGTASAGGASNDGTVFELPHGSSTITALASFDGTNGAGPGDSLIMDSTGNLYGQADIGGTFGDGTVFELAKGSGTITPLASFDGTNGMFPSNAPLIRDGSGNLYGTAYKGGASNDGTVFELAKGSGTITPLASFDGTNGQYPDAGLVRDGAGNLYGTTFNGSANNFGTVYELAKGSGTITTLASFDGTNGEQPCGDLIMDGSGNLYGTTFDGGATWATTGGYGTVFELRKQPAVDQWTGADFAVDTNWSDGANWSLGAPPTADQTALFTNDSTVKSFTATVDAGFTGPIGALDIDSTWGGTINVSSPLSVSGNFTLASGTFGGPAAVAIAGKASQWTGGQIELGTGGFTNNGTLTINPGSGSLVLDGAGTLTNNKSIIQTGSGNLSLDNGATLNNAKIGIYNIENNGGITQSGGGGLVNAGMLVKKATGTTTISTTTLSNTGTLEVAGGTMDISAAVSQIAAGTLSAGSWRVQGSSNVHSTLDITSAGSLTTMGPKAKVTLSGLNTVFTNLAGLATIDAGGSFSLLGNQSFTTAGALTNNGTITLSPGSILTVNGSFTEASTGKLALQMGAVGASTEAGNIVSTTGTVFLGGSLTVTATTLPAVGSSFEIVDNQGNAAIGGNFTGKMEGATFTVKKGGTSMTFQISYVGTDMDGTNNVVITRIS
jgi:uncharacterized repeat protein (TIGR03803 family)